MENLQDRVYNLLFKAILELEYIPGQRIVDKILIQELGVSRTPIREALVRLKRDGLLTVIPQSGTFISKIDLHSALDARFLRENIEKIIVRDNVGSITKQQLTEQYRILDDQREAIKANDTLKFFYLDNKFHENFYHFIDKSDIWSWVETASIQLNRFRLLRLNNSELPWHNIIDQHVQIIDAVANGDKAQAEAVARLHLELMLNEEDKMLHTFPDYFTNTNDLSPL
ncbi:GntR family transcriptional regulator [Agrilactobacillus yilanensis]|uniref:GntR family transcriptional regulator n=1 Tax=Agrilactobacillus yilanensis TaxID=2485997 RepID=A0ABW4J9D0_9LACO|nr:GntR family transcriptional regulator [Agrilactobacillus yilanensis]